VSHYQFIQRLKEADDESDSKAAKKRGSISSSDRRRRGSVMAKDLKTGEKVIGLVPRDEHKKDKIFELLSLNTMVEVSVIMHVPFANHYLHLLSNTDSFNPSTLF
jgi:hypothetical protein